jgi:hypothetical protein
VRPRQSAAWRGWCAAQGARLQQGVRGAGCGVGGGGCRAGELTRLALAQERPVMAREPMASATASAQRY